MKSFLENLTWRYATKKFDESKKLDPETKEKILESIRMAPTSFGLQPFRVLIIEDAPTKEALQKAGWNQPQFTTCSIVLAFLTDSHFGDRISDFIKLASGGDPTTAQKLAGYEKVIRSFVEGKPEEWLHNWAARQAYIALGFAMAACAELQIDSCPMEGFSPEQVDQILGLPPHRKTAVLLTIGYRHPQEQPRPKVRFEGTDLFLNHE